MDIIAKARDLAILAHAGQKRNNGKPYFEAHVEQVAKLVESNYIHYLKKASPSFDIIKAHMDMYTKEMIIASAYLHDVLEDTKFTLEGFPIYVQSTVKELTRGKKVSYYDFIMSIRRGYLSSVVVKLADLEHNMSDLEEGSLKDKYRFAYHILSNGSVIPD